MSRRQPPRFYDDSIGEEIVESSTITIEQVRRWFKHTEVNGYEEEAQLVEVIKKGLRTPEQKAQLNELDLSIEDCLNGRYNEEQEPIVHAMYADWNERIGDYMGTGKKAFLN